MPMQNEFVKILKKKLGEYHDLDVQSHTLILADVLENIKNKCLKICKLDSEKFLSALGLAWKVAS